MTPEIEIREPALVESSGGVAVLVALLVVAGFTAAAAVSGSVVMAALIGMVLLGLVGLAVAAV